MGVLLRQLEMNCPPLHPAPSKKKKSKGESGGRRSRVLRRIGDESRNKNNEIVNEDDFIPFPFSHSDHPSVFTATLLTLLTLLTHVPPPTPLTPPPAPLHPDTSSAQECP